ncbi:hypothetical protein ACJMK2_039127 [Sinanodonta woodiana]|uniref:VWFA domain-containing protein n=1 Tax=Sinanodonta woodiana TaxID=1069815 RepID=A0ABD3WED8_SINWO
MKAALSLIIFVSSILDSSCVIHDETRMPGANGAEVVDAVVGIIRKYCIFPDDNLYLRRLAFLLTRDGTDPITYRSGYNGGIWQVDERDFETTKSSHSLTQFRTQIEQRLGIKWSNITWTELKQPLFSGLASGLLTVHYAGNQGVPNSVEDQGSFLAHHSNKDANEFIKAVHNLETGCHGNRVLDLVFVLDSSASMSRYDFTTVKSFAAAVVGGFDVSVDNVRVAAVKFSSQVYLEFNLSSYTDKASVTAAIQKIQYEAGDSATHLALKFVADHIFSPTDGTRPDSAKVVILVTDGRSSDTLSTRGASTDLKERGVLIFTIGVGDAIDTNELERVASEPTCMYTRTVSDFAGLSNISALVQQTACNAHVILGPGSHFFKPGTLLNAKILLNVTSGTTVTVTALNSSVEVYGSTTFDPSRVLYNFRQVASNDRSVQVYIRGSTNLLLALYSSAGSTVAGRFAVLVEEGNNIRTGAEVLCIQNGITRNCKAWDIFHSKFAVLNLIPAFQSLCFPGQELAVLHPNEIQKFLYCDVNGNAFEVLCPIYEIYDRNGGACVPKSTQSPIIITTTVPSTTGSTMKSIDHVTTGIHVSSTYQPTTTHVPIVTQVPDIELRNPCTPENIANNMLIFPNPMDNTSFIKCDMLPGSGAILNCPPHKVYSQALTTCLYFDVVVDSILGIYSTSIRNPCVPGSNEYYYPHPTDPHKFIQCDQYGDAYEKTCHLNEVWNNAIKTCYYQGLQYVPPVVGRK